MKKLLIAALVLMAGCKLGINNCSVITYKDNGDTLNVYRNCTGVVTFENSIQFTANNQRHIVYGKSEIIY